MIEARTFATRKHNGQVRKFTGLPYMVHCETVTAVASMFDDTTCEVAILHDTLEDTDATYEDLEHLFGISVANDVLSLTNVCKSFGSRQQRKDADNLRLAIASSRAQTVKLADILDNVPSMLLHNPSFGRKYLQEKIETVKILTKANPILLVSVKSYLDSLKQQYK